MATTRPFAYNTGTTISGTTQFGNLAIGNSQVDYSVDYGGVKWWMGPDEDLGYVIAHENASGNQPNPIGSSAYVQFWRTNSFTDNSFLILINSLPTRRGLTPFTNTYDGYSWLTVNGYWTTFMAPTPTPTPTVTPTVTLSNTPTLTPSSTTTEEGYLQAENLSFLTDENGNYLENDIVVPTPTPSVTTTNTVTPTNTTTSTPTVTPTNTVTPTVTPTNTITPTPSVTTSVTPTNTVTPTPSSTPNIITNGLVIQLDAYNNSSYPGTGTTVYDITSGYNHTLIGATYTVLNGIKCFDCTTGNNRVDYNATGPTLPTSGYTYITWTRLIPSNPSSFRTLLYTKGSTKIIPITIPNASNTLGYWATGFVSSGYDVSASNGVWVQFAVVGTNSSQKFYINGSQVGSTINEGSGGNTHWGLGNNDVVAQPWGHVANMYFYNRQLSLSEITQQYNYLASRFI
jgi:hypothetical protein